MHGRPSEYGEIYRERKKKTKLTKKARRKFTASWRQSGSNNPEFTRVAVLLVGTVYMSRSGKGNPEPHLSK